MAKQHGEEDSPLIFRHHHANDLTPSTSSRSLPSISEEDVSQPSFSAEYLNGECFGIYLSAPVVSGAAIQRMWEGDLFDCTEDPSFTLQTACSPWATFGQNMRMAGLGTCLSQGAKYFTMTAGGFLACQLVAWYTSSSFLYWLSFVWFFIGTGYGAYHRIEMRRKFNIYGNDGLDYITHACCSWCALCQEGRTLQMNNVLNGVWTGRGNKVMIGHSKSLTDLLPMEQQMTRLSERSELEELDNFVNGLESSLEAISIDMKSEQTKS